MATYGDMVDRIGNEIDDDGLEAEVRLAILDAIKRHRSHRFWFNTVLNKTFAVAAEYVAPSAIVTGIASIEPITVVDLLKIDDGSGSNFRDVTLVDNAYIDAAQTGAVTGRPRYCALVADSDGTRLRFFPAPDLAYTAVFAGLIRFEDPNDDDDTSPWFNDAEVLIRQAAKGILAADVTKSLDDAAAADAAEGRALTELRKETLRRTPAQDLRTEVAAMQFGARRFNIYDGGYGV